MLIECIVGAAGYAAWRLWRRRRAAESAEASTDGPVSRWLATAERTGAAALDDVVEGVGRLRGDGASEDGRTGRLRALVRGQDAGADAARAADRNVALATGTLAVTVLGTTVAPALLPMALVALSLRISHLLERGLTEAAEQRKFGIAALDALTITSMFALGNLRTVAAFSTLVAWLARVIARTRDQSRQDLVDFYGTVGDTAFIERDGVEVQVPLDAVQPGDRVVVRAGEVLPVDGTIVEGAAAVDERALTGEEHPVEKVAGDPVCAGTLVSRGRVVVRVERAGRDTVAAKVVEALLNTADYRASAELTGLRIAEASVLPMVAGAGITLALLGPTSALALTLCSLGYQMRLTGPLAVNTFLGLAARHHVLVKDGRALERVEHVDTVVFDKTGTLTEPVPTVVAVHRFGDETEDSLLALAASAEHRQSHPIAAALCAEARRRGIEAVEGEEPGCEVGFGVRAVVLGRRVHVGSARFMGSIGLGLPGEAEGLIAAAIEQGRSLVWIAVDERVAGAFEVGATVRREAPEVIRALEARGLDVIILSGDSRAATRALAEELGVARYHAEVLPNDKARHIEALEADGRTVCFVGDGINDAVALKSADVSVSVRGATSLATDAAQIVLASDGLLPLVDLLSIGDALSTTMRKNLASATIPGAINIASIYLLHTGLVVAAGCAATGLAVGAVNSARARLPDASEDAGSAQPASAASPRATRTKRAGSGAAPPCTTANVASSSGQATPRARAKAWPARSEPTPSAVSPRASSVASSAAASAPRPRSTPTA